MHHTLTSSRHNTQCSKDTPRSFRAYKHALLDSKTPILLVALVASATNQFIRVYQIISPGPPGTRLGYRLTRYLTGLISSAEHRQYRLILLAFSGEDSPRSV